MSPITLGVNVTKVESLLLVAVDVGHGGRNFTGHKGPSTSGRFVIEENSVEELHPVCLTVVDEDPEGVLLSDGIGGAGVKGGRLGLGNLPHLSVELGGGSLVEFDFLLEAAGADCVEHAEDTDSVAVGGVLGHVEGYFDVRHGAEVVDFSGADVGDDGDEVGGIAEVTVVEEEFDARLVSVLIDVVNATGVEDGGTTDDSVDLFGVDGSNIVLSMA